MKKVLDLQYTPDTEFYSLIKISTPSCESGLGLKCPHAFYKTRYNQLEEENPFPEGIYFFKAGATSDPPNSVVFYREKLGTSDLERVVISKDVTLYIGEDFPEEALSQAKNLGLKVFTPKITFEQL